MGSIMLYYDIKYLIMWVKERELRDHIFWYFGSGTSDPVFERFVGI